MEATHFKHQGAQLFDAFENIQPYTHISSAFSHAGRKAALLPCLLSQVIRVFAARASLSRTIPSLAALQDRHVAQPSTSLLHFKRYTSNISRRSCLACNGTDRTKNLQQLCLVATLSKSTRPTSVIDYHNWQRMETVSRSGLMTRWLKSTAHLVATASRLRFACRYCS